MKRRSEESSFSQKLKAYKNNKLANSSRMRDKKELYPNTAKMLIQYLDLRANQYQQDKCGISWTTIQTKSLHFADMTGEAAERNFEASPGWIQNILSRNNRVRINLHGEANDMDNDKRAKIMAKWKREKFHPVIHQHNIPKSCIYNADQTGVYYQKFPNRLYVEYAKKKDYAGVKQMKDKNRETLMVCTAADGTKVPFMIVEKAKRPACFGYEEPPMHYTNHVNAWFDIMITEWWIIHVFWPYHKKIHGNVYCILILDNCSTHFIDVSKFSDRIIIIFCQRTLQISTNQLIWE